MYDHLLTFSYFNSGPFLIRKCSDNTAHIWPTYGHWIFWEIFLVESFEDFLKCELREEILSRQIFDAATLSLGVGESAFAKVWEQKDTHTQHSPQSGRWLFFGSFSMSGYFWIVDRILPYFSPLEFFLPNCAHFSRVCARIFRVLEVPLKELVISAVWF